MSTKIQLALEISLAKILKTYIDANDIIVTTIAYDKYITNDEGYKVFNMDYACKITCKNNLIYINTTRTISHIMSEFTINFSVNENDKYPVYFNDLIGGKFESVKTQDYLQKKLIDIDIKKFNNAMKDFMALLNDKI
jgi:hypothetical protein